jgi:putative tryptophan/tyrosine transport system substrate-binding protein
VRRRAFIALFSGAAVLPLAVAAQTPPRIPRVGFLGAGSPTQAGRNLDALRQGLRALGYVEGQTIALEVRWAEGRPERMSELVVELLRLEIDVLVVGTSQAALAAKKATQTIPIVMVAGTDPVGLGLVTSLARPGGNVTGLSISNEELSSKRLQLLKEFVPLLARVAVLRNPLLTAHAIFWQDTEAAARKLGLELQPLEVRGADDFETVFAAARLGNAQALIAFDDIIAYRTRVIALAASHRIPAMYGFREFPDNGGLMSYGANITAVFRRAATLVDKILKGAKPADLPVEQPTKFEFVVNLKTAKALGLVIPPAILASADDVIE